MESTLVNAANELHSNELITQDTHTDVTTHSAQLTRQRASLLIAAVNATLATFPENEQIVLQILVLKYFLSAGERSYKYTLSGFHKTSDEGGGQQSGVYTLAKKCPPK